MTKIRTAVLGCGHFGRYHAQKHARHPAIDLRYVCDADLERARAQAEEHGCVAIDDPAKLLGEVDAVSVAAPTALHYDVASPLLDAGVHCLVEKPLAASVEQGEALVALAKERGVVLQVGHLERFNPAYQAMTAILEEPLFIECHRLAGFQMRATDVSVILDLMIHDIDLVLALTKSAPIQVDSCGVDVLSRQDDIANVRLRFPTGCVANLTASRISLEGQRRMRIFQRNAYVSIDFGNRTAMVARKGAGEMYPGVPDIALDHKNFPPTDQLALEIDGFVRAVRGEAPPPVSGEDGLAALRCAMRIIEGLNRPSEADLPQSYTKAI